MAAQHIISLFIYLSVRVPGFEQRWIDFRDAELSTFSQILSESRVRSFLVHYCMVLIGFLSTIRREDRKVDEQDAYCTIVFPSYDLVKCLQLINGNISKIG